MDSELDFDPSQYTRLPPYLDNATTLALARQLLASSSSLTAPHLKRSHQTLSRASQQLANALVDSLGQEAPADKRPIDLLADHSWSAIHHRLLGWLELPPAEYPEVAQAQALFDKLFPTGLRFIQLEYGAQWAEAEQRRRPRRPPTWRPSTWRAMRRPSRMTPFAPRRTRRTRLAGPRVDRRMGSSHPPVSRRSIRRRSSRRPFRSSA